MANTDDEPAVVQVRVWEPAANSESVLPAKVEEGFPAHELARGWCRFDRLDQAEPRDDPAGFLVNDPVQPLYRRSERRCEKD